MGRAFRVVVIGILLLLTLGFGLCSALGLGIGTLGWIQSLGQSERHAHEADFSQVFLIFSVPGLLLAVIFGWLAWRLTRDWRTAGRPR